MHARGPVTNEQLGADLVRPVGARPSRPFGVRAGRSASFCCSSPRSEKKRVKGRPDRFALRGTRGIRPAIRFIVARDERIADRWAWRGLRHRRWGPPCTAWDRRAARRRICRRRVPLLLELDRLRRSHLHVRRRGAVAARGRLADGPAPRGCAGAHLGSDGSWRRPQWRLNRGIDSGFRKPGAGSLRWDVWRGGSSGRLARRPAASRTADLVLPMDEPG